MNITRMHVFTHVRESMRGQSGMPGNEYADGMIEHDGDVGKLLKALDDLGIADNTIVIYTTDNGPNQFTWPDAATTPFRTEKDTNWEGAFRVPAMVRWPGKIKAGEVSNEMFSGLDWFPTLLAAAGDTDVKDGCSRAPHGRRQDLQGPPRRLQPAALPDRPEPKGARNEFAYFNDDGELVAFRYDNWKAVFCEQTKPGGFAGLVRAVHLPAHSEALQPAHGSLRAGRHRLRPVRRLADQERLSDGLADLPAPPVPRDLRRVSAEPGAGELHDRSDCARCGAQDQGERRKAQVAA